MDEEVIPILRVQDAAKAVDWYRRLGFEQEWVHRFGPGFPAFVSVVRGSSRLFLSEHQGDARPDTLIYMRVSTFASLQKSSASNSKSNPGRASVT